MKFKIIHIIIFSCIISNNALANDNCFVIGFHEPNTHIYDGPTFCNQSHFQDITVHGPLQIKNSQILGHIDVSGPIEASHANLGDIQIEKQFTPQTISLKNHSNVNGNIIFFGPHGTVLKSKDSVIMGKIINGNLQKIKNKNIL